MICRKPDSSTSNFALLWTILFTIQTGGRTQCAAVSICDFRDFREIAEFNIYGNFRFLKIIVDFAYQFFSSITFLGFGRMYFINNIFRIIGIIIIIIGIIDTIPRICRRCRKIQKTWWWWWQFFIHGVIKFSTIRGICFCCRGHIGNFHARNTMRCSFPAQNNVCALDASKIFK